MTLVSIANNSPLSVADFTDDEVVGLIKHHAGDLQQIELAYEPQIKTVWMTLAPEPRPVFTLEMMTSINKVQRAIRALWDPENYNQSPVRFLAYRGKGHIYTLGGDLEFYLECIAKNDRAGLAEYARISTEDIYWNVTCLHGAAITLASVHALALGGGIDAPRSCNVMVGERRATFAYPEIKFNHFPISAVAILSRVVPLRTAHDILSNGKEYSADEFARIGVLDAVADDGEGESWLRNYASETLKTHAARIALFGAFARQGVGSLEDELAYLAKTWTDCMIRLTPLEISHLQRIVVAQDRLLARSFRRTEKSELNKITDGGAAKAISSEADTRAHEENATKQ